MKSCLIDFRTLLPRLELGYYEMGWGLKPQSYPSLACAIMFHILNLFLSEVELTLCGSATVHWTETITWGGRIQKTSRVHYDSSEKYFEDVIPLWGKGKYIQCVVK